MSADLLQGFPVRIRYTLDQVVAFTKRPDDRYFISLKNGQTLELTETEAESVWNEMQAAGFEVEKIA